MTNLINLEDRKLKMETDKSLAVKMFVSLVNAQKDVGEPHVYLKEIYNTIRNLDSESEIIPNSPKFLTKKQIKATIHDDYLICLEDNVKLKMLKRHLKSVWNMSVEEYFKKWGLPNDYPVVCPNYSKQRSELAKHMKLGHRKNIRKAAKPGEIIDLEDLPKLYKAKNKTVALKPVNDELDL
jgi:predicted transcriptional regulator